MTYRSDDPSSNPPPQDPGAYSQEFQHSQVGARVPDKVSRGVFSTGVLVQQGPNEFILDFVQGMVQPRQIVSRVIMPPGVLAAVLNALRDNLALYQNQFGTPPALKTPPPPPPAQRPSIEEIYGQFKLPDDLLSGVYANAALITHTQAEYCLDFITHLYPRSAVSCRVYLAAAQAPVILTTLTQSFQQYQQKLTGPGGPPPAPPPPTT